MSARSFGAGALEARQTEGSTEAYPASWWQLINWPNVTGTPISDDALTQAFEQVAIKTRRTFYQGAVNGLPARPGADFKDIFLKHGGSQATAYIQTAASRKKTPIHDELYVWDFAAVLFRWSGDGVNVQAFGFDEKFVEDILTESRAFMSERKSEGRAYVMTSSASGLDLTSIGIAGVELERGNYTPEVCEAFDNIVTDLNSRDPLGRIAILEGPPGTGKTWLIRGILEAVPKAIFVILPCGMVSSLQGPEIQALLMRFKNRDGAIVFLIEDADSVVATRGPDNMGNISTLLNITDGMAGHLFDIRAICTTNAKVQDLEPAIMRPGRLSQFCEIGPLPYGQATDVFRRIMKDDKAKLPSRQEHSLAEIYFQAKQTGRSVFVTKEKTMGFAPVAETLDAEDYAEMPSREMEVLHATSGEGSEGESF